MRNTFNFVRWLTCVAFLSLYWVSGAAPTGAFADGIHPAEAPVSCPSFTGPVVSCVNQLETYMTTPVAGTTYAWSVSAGGILSNTTGPSTLVNWTSSGTKYVILTSTAGASVTTCSLAVNVSPQPTPTISTDFVSDCPEDRKENQAAVPNGEKKEDCWVVCEGMTVNYWTTSVTGNTYQWVVVGGTPTTASGPSISVTWGPAGTGTIILTETAPGGCSETKEQCIKIVESPTAKFTFNNQDPLSGPLTICRGETVYFQDLSTGGSYWLWEFGDGGTSTLQNPSHEYNTPGTYNGTLTVKNECGCTSEVPFTVIVKDLASPEIVCVSTVCLNDCAFYSVNNLSNCPDAVLEWKIYGGTIINNPDGTSVNVRWDDNDGFIQQNGFGKICVMVSGCPDLCDGVVCVHIPVIHDVKILGPTVVCEGDPVTYYVPVQPGINEVGGGPDGVDFDWVVSANGTIISTPPYSNSITVIWSGGGTGTVDMEAYHNYLTGQECQFDPSPISVQIKPTFTVNPETATICLGGSQTFFATGGGPFNWTVSGPGGVVGPIPGGNSYNAAPTAPGTYIVSAASTSGNYCNVTPSGVLEVLPAPPTPSGTLNGQLSVCTGTPYSYTFSSPPPPGTVLIWSITGGTLYGGAGQTVTAQWNGIPPMTLSVRTMITQAPFCTSSPQTFTITNYTAPTTFVSGPTTACVNETKPYTTSLSTLANYTNLQWSVSPLIAGSVVSGQGTPNINVLFNTSAPPVVQIICTATVCGSPVTHAFNVNVTQIPSFTINANPSPACQNELVALSLSSTTGVSAVAWNFGDGTPGATGTSTSHAWAATGTFPINAQVTLNICGGPTVNATTTLNVLPIPIVSISSPNGYVICPPVNTINLVATTQFTCNYLWSTGATTPTISVTTPGVYTVTATNPLTGCASTASIQVVTCGNCNSSCTSATPPWTFIATPNCDSYTFTPNTTAAIFNSWNFGDLTGNVTAGASPVTHIYAHPGYYQVRLTTIDPVNGCVMIVQQTATVKFKGGFSFTFNCSSGTMQTVLTDRSEYLPTFTPTVSWYEVGNPTPIGTGSVFNATLSPGPHNIYMGVMDGALLCVSPTQVINVPGMPAAMFTHNAPVCEGVPVDFLNTSTGAITGQNWTFGDGATSGVVSPDRTYDAPPNAFTATLTVTNNWGCSSATSTVIPITSRGANPTITMSPSSPQCQGTPINLLANPGALPAALTYNWYNSVAPPVTVATTPGFSPALSGTYGVNVRDGNGCVYNVLSSPVVYLPPPVVQIVGKTDYCVGESIQLSASLGSPGFTYNWSIATPGGPTSQSGANVTVLGNTPGTYTFTVTITHTASGCTNTGSLSVVVHAGVTGLGITASSNCEPSTLTASGTGAVSYNWSTGDNTASTLVTQGGFYSVIASDAWGCTAKATYDLPGRPDLSNTMTGCYEFCEPVKWQATACAGCTYQWYLNGVAIPGETNPVINIGTSGTYTVEVSNGPGCTTESDPIDISISTDPESCFKCDVKVENATFECVGVDPATGNIIYNFAVTVQNNGGALHGLYVLTPFGPATLDNPPSGYLPGGGAYTTLTGQFIWNGNSSTDCIEFGGFLTPNCEQSELCRFRWCGELPKCCDKECNLKIKEVKGECIGNGFYEMTITIENYGCTLFNGFIKGDNGVFAITPSTIPAGVNTFTAIVSANPGMNSFVVCAYNYKGKRCCVEFNYELKECPDVDCRLEIRDLKLTCVGTGDNGKPIYQFTFTATGGIAGSNVIVVPNNGFVSSVGWSWSGSNCDVTGIYSGNSSGVVCFNVLTISTDDPPKICVGKGCTEVPPCENGGRSGERSNNDQVRTLEESKGFILVPNPADDAVRIDLLTPSKGVSAIRVTDITGRVRVENQAINNNLILHTQHLPAGVYYVIVTDNSGVSHSQKLIIARQ